MRITEVRFTEYKGGYRVRAEGEDLEKGLVDGVVVSSPSDLVKVLRRLALQMVPQELVEYGGRRYTASEVAELEEAQKAMSAVAVKDPDSDVLHARTQKVIDLSWKRRRNADSPDLQAVVPDNPKNRNELPPSGVTKKR